MSKPTRKKIIFSERLAGYQNVETVNTRLCLAMCGGPSFWMAHDAIAEKMYNMRPFRY